MKNTVLIFLLAIAIGCKQNLQTNHIVVEQNKVKQAEEFLLMIGYTEQDKSYQLFKKAVHFYFTDDLKNVTAEDLKETDAIFAFAFGQGEGTPPSPGGSNEGLAEVCKQLFDLSGNKLPIYAQWEIADVLLENHQLESTYKAVIKGKYLSTIGVLDQFIAFNKDNELDIKKVIVVAQRDHAFRVVKLVEKQSFNVIFGSNSFNPDKGWEQYNCDEWGYYNKSSQPWTISRGNFITHELSSVNVAFVNNKIEL